MELSGPALTSHVPSSHVSLHALYLSFASTLDPTCPLSVFAPSFPLLECSFFISLSVRIPSFFMAQP